MGVYVFKKDILLKLLRWRYPTSNDFGSEIIPSAVTEHNVQVCILHWFISSIMHLTCWFISSIMLSVMYCLYLYWHLTSIFNLFENETKFRQAYLFRDYWDDIGTIKSFYDANLALTDEVGSKYSENYILSQIFHTRGFWKCFFLTCRLLHGWYRYQNLSFMILRNQSLPLLGFYHLPNLKKAG